MRNLASIAIVVFAVALLAGVLSRIPVGTDYAYVYYENTKLVLNDMDKLYNSEVNDFYFYNLPWVFVILAPLTLANLVVASAIFRMIGIGAILAAVTLFGRNRPVNWITKLVLIASFYMIWIMLLGQLDGLILLGAALCYVAIKTH